MFISVTSSHCGKKKRMSWKRTTSFMQHISAKKIIVLLWKTKKKKEPLQAAHWLMQLKFCVSEVILISSNCCRDTINSYRTAPFKSDNNEKEFKIMESFSKLILRALFWNNTYHKWLRILCAFRECSWISEYSGSHFFIRNHYNQ